MLHYLSNSLTHNPSFPVHVCVYLCVRVCESSLGLQQRLCQRSDDQGPPSRSWADHPNPHVWAPAHDQVCLPAEPGQAWLHGQDVRILLENEETHFSPISFSPSLTLSHHKLLSAVKLDD